MILTDLMTMTFKLSDVTVWSSKAGELQVCRELSTGNCLRLTERNGSDSAPMCQHSHSQWIKPRKYKAASYKFYHLLKDDHVLTYPTLFHSFQTSINKLFSFNKELRILIFIIYCMNLVTDVLVSSIVLSIMMPLVNRTISRKNNRQ